jgi:hypothetical protein
MNTTRVIISLDNQSRANLENIANKHGMTKSNIVKILVQNYNNESIKLK